MRQKAIIRVSGTHNRRRLRSTGIKRTSLLRVGNMRVEILREPVLYISDRWGEQKGQLIPPPRRMVCGKK